MEEVVLPVEDNCDLDVGWWGGFGDVLSQIPEDNG